MTYKFKHCVPFLSNLFEDALEINEELNYRIVAHDVWKITHHFQEANNEKSEEDSCVWLGKHPV
jgi:hypothetical protein